MQQAGLTSNLLHDSVAELHFLYQIFLVTIWIWASLWQAWKLACCLLARWLYWEDHCALSILILTYWTRIKKWRLDTTVFPASRSIFVLLHVEPRLKVISSPEEDCVYVTGATCYDQGPCPTVGEVLAPPHWEQRQQKPTEVKSTANLEASTKKILFWCKIQSTKSHITSNTNIRNAYIIVAHYITDRIYLNPWGSCDFCSKFTVSVWKSRAFLRCSSVLLKLL